MTVSFIMPAYKSIFLEEAIRSIVGQTDSDWELVVVDDCSPDDLKTIVDGFHDSRISYHRNETNIGGTDLVKQWNQSISFARGEWIVMAGDDDVYDSRFCEEIKRLAAAHPEVDLIRSRVEQIDQFGGHIWDDPIVSEFSNRYEFLNGWLTGKLFTCVGNYALRKSSLESIGGFIAFPCAFCSDVATPLMLAVNGVASTNGLLFKFRQSPVHLSADKARLEDKLEATTRFYDWLDSFEYPAPENDSDKMLYAVKCHSYIQKKCIYDYYHQILAFLPFNGMLKLLHKCRRASCSEKAVITIRWIKNHITY